MYIFSCTFPSLQTMHSLSRLVTRSSALSRQLHLTGPAQVLQGATLSLVLWNTLLDCFKVQHQDRCQCSDGRVCR